MTHLTLLGDSVFDNVPYVPEGLDVTSHLKARLGPDAQVTLLAVDGSIIEDVSSQLSQMPEGVTHLALSAGANDALYQMDVLAEEAGSVAAALAKLGTIRGRFVRSYRSLIRKLLEPRIPLVVCTIYHPPYFAEEFEPAIAPGLSVFNDAILGIAFEERVPVIETRLVCNEEADFVSAIEPSESGGAKIAEAVAKALGLEPASPRSQIFAI
jgi:hypothetical protein